MVTPLRIELFDGLRATQGERIITRFRTQRAAALLSYLAYYLDRKHPREAVCDVVWPESDPTAGRLCLRVELSSLRRQLEPPGIPHGAVLVTDRLSVRLNPTAVTTDVAEFRSALQSAERANSDVERVAFLTSAVELYRGELLHGFFEEWIGVEQQRLSDAYLNALRRLTTLLEQAHDFERALDYAHRAVSADPLREESHRTLMRLYAAVGRPAAALEQYNALEHILKDELDIAPSAATCALAREIGEREIRERRGTTGNDRNRRIGESANRRGLRFPGSPVPRFPASPSSSPAGSLPLQFTRFFGREKEIAQLREMLSASNHPTTRLVTLTGVGGSGKTRLTIEVAER
jgi:DNA-binding SARP family transcriptional activator